MATPELTQFGNLSPADFERHPVWIAVHSEPCYDDSDEETFRPWTGALSAASERAPLKRRYMLATEQPRIRVGRQGFNSWGVMFGVRAERLHAQVEV